MKKKLIDFLHIHIYHKTTVSWKYATANPVGYNIAWAKCKKCRCGKLKDVEVQRNDWNKELKMIGI